MTEAEKSVKNGNAPFGALISDVRGNIIEVAHNSTKSDCDPTAHAEIKLLRKVSKNLNTRDLSNYYLFSNAESCPMCMSAAITAKINKFCFGAPPEDRMDPYLTVFEIVSKSKNKIKVESGILRQECIEQIQNARLKIKKLNNK